MYILTLIYILTSILLKNIHDFKIYLFVDNHHLINQYCNEKLNSNQNLR